MVAAALKAVAPTPPKRLLGSVLVKAGDYVRFTPIDSLEEYERLERQAAAGELELVTEAAR